MKKFQKLIQKRDEAKQNFKSTQATYYKLRKEMHNYEPSLDDWPQVVYCIENLKIQTCYLETIDTYWATYRPTGTFRLEESLKATDKSYVIDKAIAEMEIALTEEYQKLEATKSLISRKQEDLLVYEEVILQINLKIKSLKKQLKTC